MKVVLIRHGKPDFNTRQWISVDGVRSALKQYAASRVSTGPEKNSMIIDADASHYFMTSALVRSQDSLTLCQIDQAEVSVLLNEAELPHPNKLIFPLPWSCLLALYRLGWLLGYRANAPGLTNDLERARKAATLLIERACEHTNVYAFGHGVMNRLIVRELARCGWQVESRTGRGYWSRTVMSCW